MQEMFERIDYFLSSRIDRMWIKSDEMEIYIRKSKRFINKEIVNCIDFASINVSQTGVGTFTGFLKWFRKKYPMKNIFIESILTERFARFFEKNGFTRIITTEDYQRDVYLLVSK